MLETCSVYDRNVRMDMIEEVVEVVQGLLFRGHHLQRNPHRMIRARKGRQLNFFFLLCRSFQETSLLVGYVCGFSWSVSFWELKGLGSPTNCGMIDVEVSQSLRERGCSSVGRPLVVAWTDPVVNGGCRRRYPRSGFYSCGPQLVEYRLLLNVLSRVFSTCLRLRVVTRRKHFFVSRSLCVCWRLLPPSRLLRHHTALSLVAVLYISAARRYGRSVCVIIRDRGRDAVQPQSHACSTRPSVCGSCIAFDLALPAAFASAHHCGKC